MLSQTAFCWPCKAVWWITGPVGPLGSTNQNCLCARLLPVAVSIYPVVCVHSCRLLRTQRHCLWPNGREDPPSACPPTPTTTCCPPTPHCLQAISMILEGLQKAIAKTSSECCMGLWNISYKSALLIQQILHGYNAAQESHSCFNVSKRYFLKYKMWQLGQFFQIQSQIALSQKIILDNPDFCLELYLLHLLHEWAYWHKNTTNNAIFTNIHYTHTHTHANT